MVPSNAPRVPRKVLRFQLSVNSIDLRPLLCVAHNGSDAVNFYQRLAGQSRHSNGGASGTAVRKVSLEYGIHPIVILQLRQVHRELKNAVHRAAARFNDGFYAVHHHLGVHFDCRSFAGVRFVATRMSALPGDIDQSVVNNQRSDETFAGGFSLPVQFLDAAGRLRRRCRRCSRHSRNAEARQKRGQTSAKASSCAAIEKHFKFLLGVKMISLSSRAPLAEIRASPSKPWSFPCASTTSPRASQLVTGCSQSAPYLSNSRASRFPGTNTRKVPGSRMPPAVEETGSEPRPARIHHGLRFFSICAGNQCISSAYASPGCGLRCLRDAQTSSPLPGWT